MAGAGGGGGGGWGGVVILFVVICRHLPYERLRVLRRPTDTFRSRSARPRNTDNFDFAYDVRWVLQDTLHGGIHNPRTHDFCCLHLCSRSGNGCPRVHTASQPGQQASRLGPKALQLHTFLLELAKIGWNVLKPNG